MGSDADLIRRLTFDDLVADDFVSHDLPEGIPGTKDGFGQLAGMVTTAFSDRKMETDDYLDTADGRVVESWLMTARHTGEAFGVPPSGQDIRVRGVEIWRCAGGNC